MSIPEKRTLASLLENSYRLYPDKPALSYAGAKPYTYADVYSLAGDLRLLLRTRGIQKGDRVAIISQNMPNWGVAYLAITSMGAVAVPILTEFSEKEIKNILEHSEASALVVSERLSSKLINSIPGALHTALLSDDLSLVNHNELAVSGIPVKSKPYSEWVRETHHSDIGKPADDPVEDDLAVILYTSGTTGKPKGVMLSHVNLVSNAINTGHIQKVGQDDRLLSVLPLSHTYECTIGFLIPLMNGASVCYIEKPPTAAVLLPAMQMVKPTMMLTVPLIIEKIYKLQVLPKLTGSALMRAIFRIPLFRRILHKAAGRKLYEKFGGNLSFFGIGGAKLAADAEQFLRDAKFPYAIGYGLTETAPLLAGCTPSLTRYRSTGISLPGQELMIDKPNPVTGEGEILAKGPNVMKGYYRDDRQTSAVFNSAGWFRTGDLGVFDNDNFLYIKGRLKNMILGPSGENIYPEEIEAVINNQSFVLESLVYELRGRLIARVHLNYEEIEKYYTDLKDTARSMQIHMNEIINEKLNDIKQRANAELNKFSRLSIVIEQKMPFEKTPTQKIKRFLYHDQEGVIAV